MTATTTSRLKPMTSRLEGQCTNHWTTVPPLNRGSGLIEIFISEKGGSRAYKREGAFILNGFARDLAMKTAIKANWSWLNVS